MPNATRPQMFADNLASGLVAACPRTLVVATADSRDWLACDNNRFAYGSMSIATERIIISKKRTLASVSGNSPIGNHDSAAPAVAAYKVGLGLRVFKIATGMLDI